MGTLFGPCPRCAGDSWVIVKGRDREHVLRCHVTGCGFEVLMAIVDRKPWLLYSASHTAAASATR